jgi:hypothetical protein
MPIIPKKQIIIPPSNQMEATKDVHPVGGAKKNIQLNKR